MNRTIFLDCLVDSVDIQDSLDWMDARIRDREPGMIAVVNANKYWMMSKDKQLQKIIQNAELVIPEWAVFWGANSLGASLKSYVAGVALLQAAIPWAEEKGYRPYFLGAKQEVITALRAHMNIHYPGLKPAGFHHGYLDRESNKLVLAEIRTCKPDMIFVAMGSPAQEYWIEENARNLGIPIAMGVGGSFDVLAGLKKDTPSWARGRGLEWLYRLSQEPRAYWKRYLICNPWFVWQVATTYFNKS
jgi:N-acetylglucosaminyldiphosphoundecaprenol N-acetyl-beta-D-mannosaminyltransferase